MRLIVRLQMRHFYDAANKTSSYATPREASPPLEPPPMSAECDDAAPPLERGGILPAAAAASASHPRASDCSAASIDAVSGRPGISPRLVSSSSSAWVQGHTLLHFPAQLGAS